MGLQTVPSSVGAIKSVQRGTAVSAGNITISSVNINKTTVNSFSTGSSGTVAVAPSSLNAPNGSTSGGAIAASTITGSGYTAGAGNLATVYLGQYGYTASTRYGGTFYAVAYVYGSLPGSNMYLYPSSTQYINGMNFSLNSQTVVGGSTSLVSAVNGAYLTDSTTLTVTGPCRYEVIEYY